MSGSGYKMEVYVARQPIFNRDMGVHGYELLYRRSLNNFYEGLDDKQATAELINNSFLVFQLDELTSGTTAFINFSEELLEREIPLLLPKEKVVVEILEQVEPTESVIRACNSLKEKGYVLALDDYEFQDNYSSLIEIADIIKIDFQRVNYDKQREMLKLYKENYDKVFLAEKIETREEHKLAMDMGYDLFQGYFYCKPIISRGVEIGGLHTNAIQILNELNKDEPDYQKITEIIEKDLDLTYKLLKAVNCVFFGSRKKIYSIKQALIRFGLEEIKKWIFIIILKEIKVLENEEFIKNSLIRGKLMELFSIELGIKQRHLEFFLTGIFSSIDKLLNREMEEIICDLPLTSDVKDALLGRENEIRQVLDFILCFEVANWNHVDELLSFKLEKEVIMSNYIKALKWVSNLEY
jgi:EAL and modified HD-GYP domain-containing signal transduction protein